MFLGFCVVPRWDLSTSARVKAEKCYRDHDAINGESTEFEWNIFPTIFTKRILFMSMFNDISCDRKGNNVANARVVKNLSRRFGIGQWSCIGPSSEKKCILQRIVHQEPGTILRKKCCWNLLKVDILLSVQRPHCPGVSSKAKGTEN